MINHAENDKEKNFGGGGGDATDDGGFHRFGED